MKLLNPIINYDKQLLLFLHSKGSVFWDSFWIFITNPFHWIPLFFILFFFGFKVYGLKKSSLISLFTAVSVAFSLLIVNLIKNNVQRLRPLNDVSVNESIRTIIEAHDFSFVSGHSTVSFTIAFLSFWVLKKHFKFAFLIFLFPLLFAYSRLYLAAHYPLDILFGMLLGFCIALIFYKVLSKFVLKT